MLIPTAPYYSPMNTAASVSAWRNDYDGGNVQSAAGSGPLKQIAEGLNRVLGRYPQPHAMLAWPFTGSNSTRADQGGSAPFVVWSRPDWVPNGRSYTIRVLAAQRPSNIPPNSWAAHGASLGAVTAGWVNYANSNFSFGLFADSIPLARGSASNSYAVDGLNTYGGFTALDICAQDDLLKTLDSNIHDACYPHSVHHGASITCEITNTVAKALHNARRYNQGFQSTWSGYGTSNAWQYPASTDDRALVLTNTSPANLLNTDGATRNSVSPGIECKAQYTGRGRMDVAHGTAVPCRVRIYAEFNSQLTANANIWAVGPIDNAMVGIPANVGASTGLDWFNVCVALNSALDPINVVNGVNKIDLLGAVPVGQLYVRAIAIHAEYN